MMNNTFDALIRDMERKSVEASDLNLLRKYINTVGQGIVYILNSGNGIRGPVNTRWNQIKDTCKKVNAL